MADPTTPDLSSSVSPAPSAPSPAPVSPVPAVASVSTPPSPVTTPSPTPPTDTPASPTLDRPAWIPDKFWDPQGKSLKEQEFGAHYNELQARIAADDLRKAAIPSPDAYKLELPKDFVAPQGVEFKFNDADPNLAMAKAVMHDIDSGKLSGQEAFSKLLGLYAGAQVSQASTIETARQAEIAKLGPTATPRIDAIERFYNAFIGDPNAGKSVTSRLFTAADVQMEERRIAKIMGQGASSFTGGSREPPPAAGRKSDAEIAKMSMGERIDYARSQAPKSGKAA